MKLLLDPHTFLWFSGGGTAPSSKGRWLIENEANEKFASIVSLGEIAIKTSPGKLPLAKPFDQLIPEPLERNGFETLGLKSGHTAKVTQLPFHHRDPFDRLLVAQSLIKKLPLISGDAALDACHIGRLWQARETHQRRHPPPR